MIYIIIWGNRVTRERDKEIDSYKNAGKERQYDFMTGKLEEMRKGDRRREEIENEGEKEENLQVFLKKEEY